MQCSKCGAELPNGAESCPTCGAPAAAGSAEEKNPSEFVAAARVIYAGFWLRAVAFAVDILILVALLGPTVIVPILLKNRVGATVRDVVQFYNSGTRQATALYLLVQLIRWLYFAGFESSPWRATPGKKLLGLMVADLQGRRISFGRASGRYFGKILSELAFLIGYVMAGFTRRKQALHDILAGCLVVRSS